MHQTLAKLLLYAPHQSAVVVTAAPASNHQLLTVPLLSACPAVCPGGLLWTVLVPLVVLLLQLPAHGIVQVLPWYFPLATVAVVAVHVAVYLQTVAGGWQRPLTGLQRGVLHLQQGTDSSIRGTQVAGQHHQGSCKSCSSTRLL